MSPAKILVVEDDPVFASLLNAQLGGDGYQVVLAADGEKALCLTRSEQPDMLVLDVHLPLRDGLSVCREVRKQSQVPILILSSHREDYEKVVGFEAGADDYLGKPYHPPELLARVKALLRRSRPGLPGLQVGTLRLDPATHQAWSGDRLLSLTPIEFSLLEELMRRSPAPVSRADLLQSIWGTGFVGQTKTIDTHIRNLRQKLPGDCAAQVESVRGVGFRLTPLTNL